MEALLTIKNLNVFFKQNRTKLHIIRGVDFTIFPGQIVGIVGESGSGKSVSTKAILNINFAATTDADQMVLNNEDLLSLKKKGWQKVRGRLVSYVAQDPLNSLNPTRKVYKQILDVLEVHRNKEFPTFKDKIKYAVQLLERFGIREAKKRIYDYPHTFSGGQRQRIIITMAMASNPKLIVADEPTTALDPTVQAAVLELFEVIRTEYKTAIIFISHNIAVVAKLCDFIYVMYAGRVIEKGTKKEIFTEPRHPYTWALISSIPEEAEDELYTIPGTPPDMLNLPTGDPFAPRNKYALDIDFRQEPPLFQVSRTHEVASWLVHPSAPKIAIPKEVFEKIQIFLKSFDNKTSKNHSKYQGDKPNVSK